MPRSHSHRSSSGSGASHSHSQRRKASSTRSSSCGSLSTWLISLLAVFLLGTVLVLSIVKSFFGVDWNDAIDVEEINYYASLHTLPYGSAPPLDSPPPTTTIEKVPRIIHQTWKSTLIPAKWASLSSHCQAMHSPDFTYKLWTDELALDFIKTHYPWFLPTYLGYKFDIQRADVIRYFVLHKYGGIYMDLDIGCRRPLHPLLNFQTILPATKPIGVSNDLMVAEPNSPFMDSVIHNLVAFDHAYLSDYPTVMFSTGPMFLSAVLSLWNSKSTYTGVSPALIDHSNLTSSSLISNTSYAETSISEPAEEEAHHTVRILPRELYGKNIDPELVPDSFFYHYYGSSWHQNDSFIFTFFGQFGKIMMNIAFGIVLLGTVFIVVRRIKRRRNAGKYLRSMGSGTRYGYDPLSSSTASTQSATMGLLDYDSDIEEGTGRVTPPLGQIPSNHHHQGHVTSSSSSSSRRRRRHQRRAMGARHWFGLLKLGGAGSTSNIGGRRRSASTGAISLPLHSSESSGSEDIPHGSVLYYTSSSEDGVNGNARRLGRYNRNEDGTSSTWFPSRSHMRRASLWTEDEDGNAADSVQDREGAASPPSAARIAPLLHRRASSQPGRPSAKRGDDQQYITTSRSRGRTPIPPSYLELPPPPPYRPPSPLSSPSTSGLSSPFSALVPLSPLSPSTKLWISSLFGSAAHASSGTRSPTPSSSSSQQLSLPFFKNHSSSSESSRNMNGISSNSHQEVRSNNSISRHDRSISSPSSSLQQQEEGAYSRYPRQQQQQQQQPQQMTQAQQQSQQANEERDADTFSLHSIKAHR